MNYEQSEARFREADLRRVAETRRRIDEARRTGGGRAPLSAAGSRRTGAVARLRALLLRTAS